MSKIDAEIKKSKKAYHIEETQSNLKKHKLRKRVGIVLICLVSIIGVMFGYFKLCMDPYRGTVDAFAASKDTEETLSKEEAIEDLDYLMKLLKERHPAWLDGSDELTQRVKSQYESEISALDETVSVLSLWQAAARITAILHDGHTWVSKNNPDNQRYIDDLTQIHTYGLPILIDEIPIEDIIAAYKEVTSYELDFYAEATFSGNAVVCEQLLELCGIDTSDGVVMTFDCDGEMVDYSYEFLPIEKVKGVEGNGSNGAIDWVSYEIDSSKSIGIFKLTTCTNNTEYKTMLSDFFHEVFQNEISNIVVDLRGNGGGNSTVANEFMRYLDVDQYKSWDNAVRFGWLLYKNEDITITNNKKDKVFDGAVYVLTDTYTYSSAMDFAMLIGDNDLGKIVGTPSGNRPDGYGDCLYFQMPNSKLCISISFKKWHRVDQEKEGEALMPDYLVEDSDALDKVYELVQNNIQ